MTVLARGVLDERDGRRAVSLYPTLSYPTLSYPTLPYPTLPSHSHIPLVQYYSHTSHAKTTDTYDTMA